MFITISRIDNKIFKNEEIEFKSNTHIRTCSESIYIITCFIERRSSNHHLEI